MFKLAVFILLVFIIISLLRYYNQLVISRNACKYAFNQLELFLKKRHNTIIELLNALQTHELSEHNELLASLTIAHQQSVTSLKQANEAMENADMTGISLLIQREQLLLMLLKQLLCVIESNEIKHNYNIMSVLSTIETLAQDIADKTKEYNEKTVDYNNLREQIPANFIAQYGNFNAAKSFDV